MDQKSRTETLDKFRGGGLKLLVASDVAARGLDIPAVSHVFNFDIPTHAEDYIHRIGRTGRAGRAGVSITLTTREDAKHLDAILKLINRDIPTLGEAKTADKTADKTPAAKAAPEAGETAEDKPERRSRRGRRSRGSEQAAQKPEQAPATEEKKQDSAPPRREQKPSRADDRQERPARKQSKESSSSGPFDNGQIPAFLLRSTARPD